MNSATLLQFPVVMGLQASIAAGEVSLTTGVPSLYITNLPQAAGDAIRDTIGTAIRNSNMTLPQCRITADLPDHDPRQPAPKPDLTIAVAILIASGQVPAPQQPSLYLGNLEADGSISPTPATISIATAAQSQHFETMYVPSTNAAEAAIAQGVKVYPVDHLKELAAHLRGDAMLESCGPTTAAEPAFQPYSELSRIPAPPDVKRALEIAAAGNLPIMLSGPPGAGRTLLARALAGIMPRLSEDQALECAALRSLAGQNDQERPLSMQPPFRAPHHTISDAGLKGGGRFLKPGELSLSHRGVLFIDPLTDFNPQQQAAVCRALAEREVTVTRINSAATYPADFLLAVGSQPCPCGYQDATEHACVCTPAAAERYRRRVTCGFSGSLGRRFSRTSGHPGRVAM